MNWIWLLTGFFAGVSVTSAFVTMLAALADHYELQGQDPEPDEPLFFDYHYPQDLEI